MRKLLLIIIFIPIVFVSCFNSGTYKEKMVKVEMIIDHQPDSAYYILQNEIIPSGLSKKQHADWCLLLTKAKDKLYMEHENDSLINIAVDYYKSVEDSEKLMEAYYYVARIAQDSGNQLKAQEFFMKAMDEGENSNNYPVLARIYNNIGALYMWHRAEDLALPYIKKGIDFFGKANDTINLSSAYKNIASIYALNKEVGLDSAIYYFEKRLRTSSKEDLAVYEELLGLYCYKKDFKKAYSYLQKLGNKIPIVESDRNWGLYYYYSGNLDSAEYYFDRYMSSTKSFFTQRLTSWIYYDIYKQKENYVQSLEFLEKYNTICDSIAKHRNAASIRWVNETQKYHKEENELNEAKVQSANNEKRTYQLYSIVFILLIILLAVVLLMRRKRKLWKKKEADLREHYEAINKIHTSIIAENEVKIKKLLVQKENKKNKEREIVESRIKLLKIENEKLVQAEHQRRLLLAQFKETEIYKRIHSDMDKFTEEDRIEISFAVDKTYPTFFDNLKKLHPFIKNDELIMCVLFKTDIKLKTIAKYMNLTPQAIAMKRDRLYQKIHNKKGKPKDFEDFIDTL